MLVNENADTFRYYSVGTPTTNRDNQAANEGILPALMRVAAWVHLLIGDKDSQELEMLCKTNL